MDFKLSMGTAAVCGLRAIKTDISPTTAYIMLGEHCTGNCQFCAQAVGSHVDKKFLSRISWAEYPTDLSIRGIQNTESLRRICIQTLKYPGLADDLMELLNDIKKHSQLPISVCVNPLGTQTLQMLKMSGVDRIGIGLDCASERIFNLIKPGFSWKEYTCFIQNVVDIFGRATAHLIVGLGETDEEMAAQFQRLLDMNCRVGLFAYTPVRGNQMNIDSPIIGRYRAFQLIRYLFVNKLADFKDVVIKNNRLEAINIPSTILHDALWNGEVYQTSGCPGCNRPMYNERPGKTTYNYAETLSREQLHGAVEQLISYLPSVGMLR